MLPRLPSPTSFHQALPPQGHRDSQGAQRHQNANISLNAQSSPTDLDRVGGVCYLVDFKGHILYLVSNVCLSPLTPEASVINYTSQQFAKTLKICSVGPSTCLERGQNNEKVLVGSDGTNLRDILVPFVTSQRDTFQNCVLAHLCLNCW